MPSYEVAIPLSNRFRLLQQLALRHLFFRTYTLIFEIPLTAKTAVEQTVEN